MLDLKLHSCVDLAHVYGYDSDCGSFKDCVHCSLLFSSIFVLHSLRIKVYYINPGPVVIASSLLDTTHYNTKFIVPTVYR